MAVAIDHRLSDLRLQGQHSLDPLRRDIVALVENDQILLAVGDDDPALGVEMADVAGVQPAVVEHPRGFLRVTPIAVHDVLALDHDLAVLGDGDHGVHQRRADGFHADARLGPVAADHRPGLGLAIALQHRQPHRLEEQADVGIERRAPGHHRLHPPAELVANLLAQGQRQYAVHRQIERVESAGIAPGLDGDGTVHQIGLEAAVFLDRLHDLGAQHLEQTGDDDHDRRLHLFDVGGELFEAFGVINLGAERDREVLAAGMLIGVAGRQEGQEHLLLPAKVGRDDVDTAFDIVQDHAVVLPHPAWGATGARRVDQAGEVVAADLAGFGGGGADIGRAVD